MYIISEKDGFLLLHFFAELPMEAVLMKWTEYAHIDVAGKDTDYVLDRLEEYVKDKNQTMEMVVKETLSRWIDDGVFVLLAILHYILRDYKGLGDRIQYSRIKQNDYQRKYYN